MDLYVEYTTCLNEQYTYTNYPIFSQTILWTAYALFPKNWLIIGQIVPNMLSTYNMYELKI